MRVGGRLTWRCFLATECTAKCVRRANSGNRWEISRPTLQKVPYRGAGIVVARSVTEKRRHANRQAQVDTWKRRSRTKPLLHQHEGVGKCCSTLRDCRRVLDSTLGRVDAFVPTCPPEAVCADGTRPPPRPEADSDGSDGWFLTLANPPWMFER